MHKLFSEHIKERIASVTSVLESCQLPGLIIDAGSPEYYYADDAHIPFRPTPHFAHWCPASGHSHLLVIKPDSKPILLRFLPEDFWHDPTPIEPDFWKDGFELRIFGDQKNIWEEVRKYKNFGYIGPQPARAREFGLITDSKELEPRLNWERTIKSQYEIKCLELATEKASHGHNAARLAFANGASEIEIFHAYLKAVGETELKLPYGTIICLNEKSAILHYEHKRTVKNGHTFLIDSGAKVFGYGSDITRSYAIKHRTHPLFIELLASMEELQQHLANKVQAGCNFTKLHEECVAKTGSILLRHGILKDLSEASAVETGLTRKFFPHGLGHMLGIQVHDVGGRQIDPIGTPLVTEGVDPALRTTRVLRQNEVVTIEPGLYFIPTLLEKVRNSDNHRYVNWSIVDALYPCGGIRIEDNVVALSKGSYNITRAYLKNDYVID